MDNLISNAFIFLCISGCIGIFIWVGISIYITSKWLEEVELTLVEGTTFYSSSIIFKLQGALHYASIFFWSFLAKRYGMLEKRKEVAKNIRQWFVFAFCWFLISALLLFSGLTIGLVYLD